MSTKNKGLTVSPNDSKPLVSRSAFRLMQIPLLPFCDVKTAYSTKYFDSFHIKNSNTNCQLNIFCRIDGQVTVSFYDAKIKKLRDRNKEVYRSNVFTQNILESLCCQFLS